jgi:photosystem II stability/assembly factor-like uncharacterized protein
MAAPLVLLKAVNYSGTGAWNDESGNGNNATKEYGTIAKNAAGNGIVLNGSTSWTFPNVQAGASWTINVWYKQTGPIPAAGTNPCLVTQILANNTVNMALSFTDQNRACNTTLRSGGYYSGGTWYQTAGPVNLYVGSYYPSSPNSGICSGAWGNIQIVWNGTTMAIYTDGSLAYRYVQTITGPGSTDSGAAYVIGRNWTNLEYLIGEIGEVRIYNSAISSNKVYTDYYESLPTFRNLLLMLKAVDFKQIPITDPTTIPGCQLWLDSADQTTLTLSGSTVTQWRDKSGQVNNTTTVTGTPIYSAGNGIVFNGSSYLIGAFNTPITTAVTAFAVATLRPGNTVSNRILSVGTTGTHDYTNTDSSAIIFGDQQIMYTGRYGAYPLAVSLAAYDTAFLVSVNQYPGYQSISLNGNTPVSSGGSYNAFNLVNYAVGTELGGDPSIYNGIIKEILLYNTVLSDGQHKLIEGYLAWKWGLESQLASSHPYRYSRPTVWQDESGKGNDAVLNAGSIAKNSDSNGVVFSGTTIWIFPNIYAISDWTVNIWYKRTSITSAGNIVGQFGYKQDCTFQLVDNGDSNVALQTVRGGEGPFQYGGVSVTLNQWVNIQYTHYASTLTLSVYVNGQLITGNSDVTSTEGFIPYYIGASGLIAEIGEISVYGYPFNQTQITAQYNSSYYVFNKSLRVLLKASDYSGTGNWQDETGNGFNATLHGTATKNIAGNGLILNGSTYWSFSDVGVISIWTVGVWYKVSDPTVAGGIVTQIYDGSNGNGPTLNYNTSTVNGSFKTSGTTYSGTPVSILPGQWINIQITWDGTNMKTYINGVLKDTSLITGYSRHYTTGYYIGKGPVSGLVKGEIGELRIYSYALNQTEVTADYNASYSTFNKLMVLLKAVDYTSGAWTDETGNGFNATIENGTATKNGAGNGLVLNGSTSWTFSNIGVGNTWTASIWYKQTPGTNKGNDPCILTQQFIGGRPINILIGYPDVAILHGAFFNGAFYLGSTITLTDGAWTNIQVTWDGINMKTYINSSLLGTTPLSGISADGENKYLIGRRWDSDGAGYYMVGEIGELRIYNYAISQAQVTADYNSSFYTFSGPTAPSVPLIHIRPKVSINTIQFNWQPPALDGGILYHYELSSPQDTRPSGGYYTIPSTARAYVVTGLTIGILYTFSIKAVNSIGSSPIVTYRSAYVGPRVPRLATAVAVPTSSNSAIIQINDSRSYFTQLTSSGSKAWVKIVSSADGTILAAAVGGASQDYIYTSNDSGATWTQQTESGSRYWSAIAMSSDGSKLVAGISGGGVWTSLDSGATWTALSGVGDTTNSDICASSDGSVFYRVAYGGGLLRIYYSAGSWTHSFVGTGAGSDLTSVACSANGTIVYITVYGLGIWKSVDSGSTFVNILYNTSGWVGIRCSSSGQYLVAISRPLNGNSGYIWTSSNYGVSWSNEPQILNSLSSLAISSDGSIMAVAENGGSIWISNDHGGTFVEQTATTGKAWYSLALSSDGYKMVGAVNGNYIYSLNVLYSYHIGWTAARTMIQFGSGISYKNGNIFGENTITINNGLLPNNLDLINNMYTFNMSYVNSSGYSAPVGTNPIGNIQYSVTNPSKTYYNKGFISVASSADSLKMVACAINEYLYTTTDGGVNWIQRVVGGTGRAWQAVASSADGTKFIASESGSYMWTSSDYGVTWIQQTGSGIHGWGPALAMSANGQYIVAGNAYGYIYTSADGGVTWTERTESPALYWYGLAISNDGITIYAGDFASGAGGYIWKSTDSGATWAAVPYGIGNTCYRIVSSADGTKLVASDDTNGIWTTTDSGLHWTKQLGSPTGVFSLASSSDGVKLALTSNNSIWTSNDSGVTWTPVTGNVIPSASYLQVACKGDGTTIYAVGDGDGVNGVYIWKGVYSGSLWTWTSSLISISSPSDIVIAFNSIACSKNGRHVYVGICGQPIWYNNNFGVGQWTKITSSGSPTVSPDNSRNTGLACSDDGSVIICAQGTVYVGRNYGVNWNSSGNPTVFCACAAVGSINSGIVLGLATDGLGVYISTDVGATWTRKAGSEGLNINAWRYLAMSNNGSVIAGAIGNSIIISSDSGATWYNSSPTGQWTCIRMSSDTTKIIACSVYSYIYLSTNSGQTWKILTAAGSRNWTSIAVSADFTKITATAQSNSIYYSKDSGVTWTQGLYLPGGVDWKSITGDPTGKYLTVVAYNYVIWFSRNYGASWYYYLTPGNQAWSFPSLSMSPDGSVLVAGTVAGGVFISNNGGVDWRVIPIFQVSNRTTAVVSAFISADNSFIALCNSGDYNNGQIWISSDSGYSWIKQVDISMPGWLCIAGSANGQKLYLGGLDSSLWVSHDQGLTWAQISTWTGGIAIDIACDSTGTRVAAVGNNPFYIWLSSDSGMSWTPQAWSFNYSWNSITSDSTGRYLAASSGSNIWTSANYGATWTQRLAAQSDVPFRSISSSAYGNNLIAVVSNPYNEAAGFWWMSSDFGVTWNKQLSITHGFWGSAVSSANAKKVVAAYLGGYYASQLYIGTIN